MSQSLGASELLLTHPDSLPIGLLMKKHIWLTGQGNATRLQIADALTIAAQPSFRVMTELLPLEDINIALDRLRASDVTGRIVLSLGAAEGAKSLP